jgi:hypothetical protein
MTAHELAHRCVTLDTAQQVVFFRGHHDCGFLSRARRYSFLSPALS